jgi:two-component system LytT family response regulator
MTEDFKIRVLIVDDEPEARLKIRNLLARHADMELVGECTNGYEAVAAIKENTPDLVFLDVEMPEISGFEVLNRIEKGLRPLVIIVTVHKEHALKAYDFDPVHFLHKPVDRKRFDEALQRAKTRLPTENERRILALLEKKLSPEPRPLEWVVIKGGARDLLIKTKEIDWIDASGKYTWIHVGQKAHLSPKPIGILEAQLDPKIFARGNRSFIVNINFVQEILHPSGKDGYRVVLKNGTKLSLSTSGREKIKHLLGDDV